MGKEIIIERKKSKSIRTSLFMFIITLIMILPIVFYFGDFDFITSDIPLVDIPSSIPFSLIIKTGLLLNICLK